MPSGNPDYACEITDTNRVYDLEAEDIFGPGFFILEVALVQEVVVDSSSTLTDDQVWSIVETGFSRGAGGRVRFRSLLQSKSEFNTVLNVEVLPGALSPPQAAPSATPSVAPSVSPSASPTSSPSTSPSSAPTMYPTTSPTTSPTNTPTVLPTFRPTPLPTTVPVGGAWTGTTAFPTNDEGNIPLSADDDGRQPLILGAIAGGLATIFVSFFFIFCIWHPFCKDRDDETTRADDPGEGIESGSSSQSDRVLATLIPGVVNVSDESASLADSTLGEQTSIRRPPSKKPRVPQSGGASQPPVTGQDSFDESSLYTSTTEPEKTQNIVITKLLPESLNNTLDYEDDIIFPMSGSGSESESELDVSVSTPTTPLARRSIDMSKSSIDRSESTRRISNVGGNFDDTDDSSFLCSSPVESDEEKAKAVSRLIDRNTKGFDPFADDSSSSSSSFAFDKVEPVDSVYYGRPSYIHGDDSSPSNTTTSTKDVERLLLGSMRTAETHTAGDLIVQDHVSDSRSKGSQDSPNSRGAIGSPEAISRRVLSDDREANNKLLRSVLEDARSLSDKRSRAARSSASRQSAPSRINKYNVAPRSSRTSDLLANHLDFHGRNVNQSRRKSSMSVGAPPLPRGEKDEGDAEASLPRRSPRKKSLAEESNQSTDSASLPDRHRPYRTRYLESGPKRKPPSIIPLPSGVISSSRSRLTSGSDTSDTDDDALVNAVSEAKKTPESPSSASTSVPPSPSGHLGAEPRAGTDVWNIASEDSVMHVNSDDTGFLDTPASSPGVLGIADNHDGRILKDDSSTDSDGLSNPWLFDVVEQTLGPRSANADMESISGRSSRSGRSMKSAHGRSSRRSRSRHRRGTRDSSMTRSRSRTSRSGRASQSPAPSSTRSTGHPSFPSVEDHEMALEPKNLEHDLKRLQLQIADVLQSEMDQVVDSNITVSTAGEKQNLPARPYKKKKKPIVVIVPPGKLGIVLANRQDGKGTVVEEVRPSSVMTGMVKCGDKIVAVDEKDVTSMTVNEITTLMASRVGSERRLSFISVFNTVD